MPTSRRDFLLGLAGLAIPAPAAPETAELIALHYRGSAGAAEVLIRDAREVRTVPVDASEVEDFTQRLRNSPTRESMKGLYDLADKLYERLWRPIGERALRAPRIAIRAEGVFQDFPFESLRNDDAFLGNRLMIHYLVSSGHPGGVRKLGAVSRGRSFVYAPVASDGLSLPALPASVREARLVRGLVNGELRVGRQATREQLRQDTARPFAVLHLATHGIRGRNDEPRIALRTRAGNEKARIEFLAPPEIARMRLNGRLVVLSACDSAVRPASPRGLGLGEAFVRAGVREVIGARWAVDDAATLLFMQSFYQKLAEGLDSASALRSARAAMITSQYLPYAYPHFWAGFVSLVKG